MKWPTAFVLGIAILAAVALVIAGHANVVGYTLLLLFWGFILLGAL